MTEHSTGHSTRPYYIVYGILMALMALTVGAAVVDFSQWNLPSALNLVLAMTIATVKSGLILVVFMHLRESSSLTWLFAAAAVVWLGIMMALTLNDYLFRLG